MSDDEHMDTSKGPSQEELDAEREAEAQDTAAAASASKQRKRLKKKITVESESDSEAEKEDEAMEKRPSEGESSGGESEPDDSHSVGSEESETEDDKRVKLASKLRFIDDEAAEEVAEEYINGVKQRSKKSLKRKRKDDSDDEIDNDPQADVYESSGLDDDDEVVYETDVEEERRRLGKKPKGKIVVKAEPEQDDDDDASKAHSDSEAEQVADASLERMKILGDTHESKKVKGLSERKRATHIDHAQVMAASRAKKDATIDPQSLVDSPKKEKKPTITKKPSKKSSAAAVPQEYLPVGALFTQTGDRTFRVTYRGQDALVVKDANNRPKMDHKVCSPVYWTTALQVVLRPDGTFHDTECYALFHIVGKQVPKMLNDTWAKKEWENNCSLDNEQRYKYTLEALSRKNMQDGTTQITEMKEGVPTKVTVPTKRMFFTTAHFDRIKSQAMFNERGEYTWCPSNITRERDPHAALTLDGEVAPAPPAPAAAIKKSKKKDEPKTILNSVQLKNNKKLDTMLKAAPTTAPTPATKVKKGAAPSAPAAACTPPMQSFTMDNLFGEPEAVVVPDAVQSMFKEAGAIKEFFSKSFESWMAALKTQGRDKSTRMLQTFIDKISDGALLAQDATPGPDKFKRMQEASNINFQPLLVALPLICPDAARLFNDTMHSMK